MQRNLNWLNRNRLLLFCMITLMLFVAPGLPSHADAANPVVRLETSMGDITIELYEDEAPLSVANFLHYVANGYYDGDDGNGATIFHRVVDDFVIQGGGFKPSFYTLANPLNAWKVSMPGIPNEADNGLENDKYTIAMARSASPGSANSQFFINLKDNPDLDHVDASFDGWGYAVFGKVIDGTSVVDAIGSVATTDEGFSGYSDVPVNPVVINNAVIEGLENMAALDNLLYYTPVVSDGGWDTEISVINSSDTEELNGLIQAYGGAGLPFSGAVAVSLPPSGRRMITVSEAFPNAESIRHIRFKTDEETAYGYTSLSDGNIYQAAVPAVKDAMSGDIPLPLLVFEDGWWTALSLLNDSPESQDVEIEIGTNQVLTVSLDAGQHYLFLLNDVLPNQTGIQSAVINDASDLVVQSFVGNSSSVTGFHPRASATELYYPLLITTPDWWTALVVQNPGDVSCDLRITPYTANGVALASRTVSVTARNIYAGLAGDMNLADAAWLKVEATETGSSQEEVPVAGLSVIGNAGQMAGFSVINITSTSGILPRLEENGWSGFGFVNTSFSRARINLTAYTDAGTAVDTAEVTLESRSQVVLLADGIFGSDISDASYIKFTSSRSVAAFQANGSADNMRMDGLPVLSAE